MTKTWTEPWSSAVPAENITFLTPPIPIFCFHFRLAVHVTFFFPSKYTLSDYDLLMNDFECLMQNWVHVTTTQEM